MRDATEAENGRAGTSDAPDASDADCRHCGCRVADHDPVLVAEGVDRTPAGWFCNYGCLAAHVEDAGLANGAVCRVDFG